MFAFLALNYSKYIIYLLAAAALLAAIWFGIHEWELKIAQQAQLEFNNQQLQQTIKDQKIINEQLTVVNDNQNKIIIDLNEKNSKLVDTLKKIDEYLDSDAAKKIDHPASKIIKKTIEELGN